MRLLIISTEFPPGPGGIGTHAYHLANGLHQGGWDVTVVTRQDYATRYEINSFNKAQAFRVVTVPPIGIAVFDAIYRWYVCRHIVHANNIDLIVLTGAQSLWFSLLLPQNTVAIAHGTELGASGVKGILARQAFERVKHVVCVSEFTRRQMHTLNINQSEVSVIHNAADDKIFRSMTKNEIQPFREKLGFSDKDKLLLTVGTVSLRKGHDIVIRSLPYLLDEHLDIHYLIAGLPNLQRNLETLASELGVRDRVHFLGKVPTYELLKLYNVCDIFVMTSRHTHTGDFEGYGIAVIEAALCGKTSVVSGDSGLSEAVIDGETGLIVPQNDPIKTASAISSLFIDHNRQLRLARNAQDRATANGSWSHKIQEYHDLFRNLI